MVEPSFALPVCANSSCAVIAFYCTENSASSIVQVISTSLFALMAVRLWMWYPQLCLASKELSSTNR